ALGAIAPSSHARGPLDTFVQRRIDADLRVADALGPHRLCVLEDHTLEVGRRDHATRGREVDIEEAGQVRVAIRRRRWNTVDRGQLERGLVSHRAFEMNMQLSQGAAFCHSDGRLAEAAFFDRNGLAIAGPRWRCETEKSQSLITKSPKLKRALGPDDHRRAFRHTGSFAADPDFTTSTEEVPDLLD